MIAPILLALALAGAPAAAPAPAAQPFTIDELLAMPRVAEPALSPDGALVAFTVAELKPDRSGYGSALWVVPAAGGEPRRLTTAKERVSSPRFSPDGKRLAFLSSRSGKTQVHALDLAGGEAAQLTSLPTEAGGFLWAPDGRALLVLSDVDPACGADPACNERKDAEAEGRPHRSDRLLFRHWNEWRERKRSHVLLVPAAGGAAVDLTPGDRDVPPAQRGDAGDLAVTPDGRSLLFVAVTDPLEAASTNGDLFTVPLADPAAAPRRLTTSPGFDSSPRFSPDGKRLAWLSQPRAGYESDKRRLLISGPDGADPKDLTAGYDGSVREAAWAGPDRLLLVTEEDGGTTLYQVAARGGALEKLWHGGQLHGLSPSRDGRRVAAVLDTFDHPPEVVVVEGGKVRPLTHFTDAAVSRLALGQARRATARAPDGATVPGFIVTPPGHQPGQRHPAVVLVHGGPQGAWIDDWHYRWNTMLWASQGWTVVIPNFRGSSSYGMAWQDAIRGNWGDGPFGDVMAFADMAVKSGEADGERMCAAGASYGGYLVNWINGHTDRFKCLVAHAGDFDLFSAYFDTEELWFPEWEMKGTPFENEALYRKLSPSTSAGRWKTPTLVTHGELDFRVAVNQGFSTFTALQRRGVPSRLLVFPDEGHHILKPRNAKAFHDEVFGWIRSHIGPAAAR